MTSRHLLIAVAAAAAVGFSFASFSTHDFVQHYDRQVHSVHCSFLPGITAPDATGSSGCQVSMLSPYSSVLRRVLWGGIPISLPAMSVFAFLVFLALETWWSGRLGDPRALGFLTLATSVPVAASVVMGIIAAVSLGTACKLCIGIYAASAAGFAAALTLWRRARREALLGLGDDDLVGANDPPPPAEPKRPARDDDPAWADPAGAETLPDTFSDAVADTLPDTPPSLGRRPTGGDLDDDDLAALGRAARGKGPAPLGAFVALGVLFVAAPVGALVVAAPDHDPHILGCGLLRDPSDRYGVLAPLPMHAPASAPAEPARMIEVLDPLCPACRALEQSLTTFSRRGELARQVALFPLDNQCNWMVDRAIHPGSCTISEAVLCAGERAPDVLRWAFAEQEAIIEAASQDPRAARRMVKEAFPDLGRCVGSSSARARLNKSLRWAVHNRLRVLTPQLFIEGVRVCEEDLDLGLEYALGALLDGHAAGTLPEPPPLPPPAPPADPDEAELAPGDEAVLAAKDGDLAADDAHQPPEPPAPDAPDLLAEPPAEPGEPDAIPHDEAALGAPAPAGGEPAGTATSDAALRALERARRLAWQEEERRQKSAPPSAPTAPPAPEDAADPSETPEVQP